jgi:hypothetical protein
MFFRAATHAAVLAAGLTTLGAHGDVIGGHPLTVTSATGFVTLTGAQPTSAFGFLGDWTRDGADGSVTVPFAGWADFGLPGDRLSVDWNFTAVEPDRFLWWRLESRAEPGRVLAGVEWIGSAWQSTGLAEAAPGAAGRTSVTLDLAQVGRTLRISYGGLSVGPDGSAMGGVSFAVPSPGAAALVALAATVTRRRR